MTKKIQYEIAGIKIGEGNFDAIVKSKFNDKGEFFTFDIARIDNIKEWRKVIEDALINREIQTRKFSDRMKEKNLGEELENIKNQTVGTYDITQKVEKRLAKERADEEKVQEIMDKVNEPAE